MLDAEAVVFFLTSQFTVSVRRIKISTFIDYCISAAAVENWSNSMVSPTPVPLRPTSQWCKNNIQAKVEAAPEVAKQVHCTNSNVHSLHSSRVTRNVNSFTKKQPTTLYCISKHSYLLVLRSKCPVINKNFYLLSQKRSPDVNVYNEQYCQTEIYEKTANMVYLNTILTNLSSSST